MVMGFGRGGEREREKCLVLDRSSYLKILYTLAVPFKIYESHMYTVLCDPPINLGEKMVVLPLFRRRN